MDLINKMGKAKADNDCIVSIVDLLTKRVHFTTTTEKELTAEMLAKLLI